MKQNQGYYIQKINETIQETEKVGEEMNPYYEKIREGIDQNKNEIISENQRIQTIEVFKQGIQKYHLLLEQLVNLKAPAKAIGIQKKLEKAYTDYLTGCEEMLIAIQDEKIDIKNFNDSELKQDEASETISFCIQKMTNFFLKK